MNKILLFLSLALLVLAVNGQDDNELSPKKKQMAEDIVGLHYWSHRMMGKRDVTSDRDEDKIVVPKKRAHLPWINISSFPPIWPRGGGIGKRDVTSVVDGQDVIYLETRSVPRKQWSLWNGNNGDRIGITYRFG